VGVGVGAQGLPGEVLPVRPSTLRDFNDLQKFYPSGYPSGGVRRAVRNSRVHLDTATITPLYFGERPSPGAAIQACPSGVKY
jgi:hypothetical protein